MLLSKLQLGIITAGGVVVTVALALAIRQNAQLGTEIARQSESATATSAQLSRAISAEMRRLKAAEAKVDALLKAAREAGVQANLTTPAALPVDSADAVKAVTARAQQMIKDGKQQAALDEYINCYRDVRRLKPGSSECQRLLSVIKHLGRSYPAAIVALRRLRDDAMAEIQSGSRGGDLVFEIALLNERLDEGHRTLALYDSLLPGDVTRRSLAMIAIKSFIEARRYEDALLGRNFGQMLNWLEGGSKSLASQDSSRQDAIRKSVIDSTATHIEVLTGAGKMEEARVLTEKLLAFDNSLATQTTLRQHVDRANAAK